METTETITIFHNIMPPIKMQVTHCNNGITHHLNCTTEHHHITVIIGSIYPNKKRTENEKNTANLHWNNYDNNGPNTIIDDDTVNHNELKHLLSSIIEYIRMKFEYINILYLQDSGYFEFNMYGQEGSINWKQYLYYNIAIFGETWFERYFNASFYLEKYYEHKEHLFTDPSKYLSWNEFKYGYIMPNETQDFLQVYYESSQTMREFFLKIRKNHSPIETCKIIGQWIQGYISHTYDDNFTLLGHCYINIKNREKYNITFITDGGQN